MHACRVASLPPNLIHTIERAQNALQPVVQGCGATLDMATSSTYAVPKPPRYLSPGDKVTVCLSVFDFFEARHDAYLTRMSVPRAAAFAVRTVELNTHF